MPRNPDPAARSIVTAPGEAAVTAVLSHMNIRKPVQAKAREDEALPSAIDLNCYTPAYFTFIANKLARDASQHYLDVYGVGIETWRVLVMLAIEDKVTAQRVVQVIGMDKGSVSRAFKAMHEQGLIEFSSDPHDGRLRYANFTPKGRDLHARILRFALMREQVFLSALETGEVSLLIDMLRRLHAALPAVAKASDEFMDREREALGKPARRRARRPPRPKK